MKRRIEAEMAASEIRSAIAELALLAVNTDISGGTAVGDTTVQVPIKPFLNICNLIIHVLDKIGPTMVVLRQDIHQNIQRFDKFHDSNPLIYWDVVEILKKEVDEGNARKGHTSSKAFVWFNRSIDFTLALLQLLAKDLKRNMEEAYNLTLKQWHGWISSTAYKVALKLVPNNQTLVDILKAKDENCATLKEELENLISLLVPVL